MQNIDNIRHSLSHLLAAAVLKKFPRVKFGIGPVIENGFYYDFELPRQITNEDLRELENEMRKFIKEGLVFSQKDVSIADAKKLWKNQLFKLELIKELAKENKIVSIYITGSLPRGFFSTTHYSLQTTSCFIDLCKGGHVKNAGEINPDGFKLDKTAGAYWRGDEKNPMLTRIYGLAFATKKELDEYVVREEEARKRDHKKLGPELDLFTFSELVGSGLPLWTPKGTVLRNILDNFVWELRKKAGYEQVDIPHLTKKALYEKSGHWEKFKDELFKITTREGHIFALKPMNCPHHTQIYARKPHSYRELPQRYATTTKVYRDEQTGELSGLSRVRAITQDDAHVFCRKSQIREEMEKIWDIIEIFYSAVGFKLSVRLSLRDPKQPQKYLGSLKAWEESENELRALVAKRKVKAEEAIGEAAFYGPKIDFIGKDSLGREWQVATIQLDMNMPENFDLSCTNEEGKPERVVMIHAAIMGSIERYLAIIIEHFAGAFPLWLAPVQVAVLPVSDKHVPYAKTVMKILEEHDIRAELPEANETLGKRIRTTELMKVPLIVVVGDKEAGDKSVNVRERGKKDTQTIPLAKFVEETAKRAAERK